MNDRARVDWPVALARVVSEGQQQALAMPRKEPKCVTI